MIVLIAATLGGGDGNSGDGRNRTERVEDTNDHRPVPESYEVQSGDTLTSIAHETGVPVAVIVKLNPGVDPQILVAGERLKLR
ncbi:MAG TPA: LysM domain-containing protein [Solirubrobacterales bacterium]|nr:LysM domain-containing protein [Solirubrobacterales bacterium]